MRDVREILIQKVPNSCYWSDMDTLVNTPINYVTGAMDDYAKEFLVAYLENQGMEEGRAKTTANEFFYVIVSGV